MLRTASCSLILLAAATAFAETPRTADSLLDEAKIQAESSHKAIWAMFHASW
jgi:hypothetical protein